MKKSLGEIAFEAREKHFTTSRRLAWEDQAIPTQEYWEKVAGAVALAMRKALRKPEKRTPIREYWYLRSRGGKSAITYRDDAWKWTNLSLGGTPTRFSALYSAKHVKNEHPQRRGIVIVHVKVFKKP